MGIFTGILLVDLIGVVTTLVAVVYAYYKWSFQYWKRRNIPQLKASIPFGTFLNPWTKTISLGDEVHNMYKEAKAKGYRHCGVYSMTIPDYLVMDLDIAKCILTKDFNNFSERGNYHNEKVDPLTHSIFNLGGSKWKKLRTKLTPTFTSGKLKAMFPTLLDQGVILDKYFEEYVKLKKGPFDLKDILGCFTNDITGSIFFGLDCDSLKQPNSPFRVYGKKLFLPNSLLALRSMFNVNFPAVARFLGLKDFPTDVTEFFIKIVDDTVRFREKNNYTRNDFLQLLIDLRNSQKDQENDTVDDDYLTMGRLAAQCFSFWVAGFETSSSATAFASYFLATHPDIQQRARDEILTVLAKHDGQITYDSLFEMNYLSQVINETMRMFPALGFITRQAEKDYKFPGEDVVLEAGTKVLIPILGYHFDEDYYPNPEKFDPDRFTEENKKSRDPYMHMPFGAGPRTCIGERLGLVQVKLALITILRKFNMTLNKKTIVPLTAEPRGIVTTPKGGVWVDLEKIGAVNL